MKKYLIVILLPLQLFAQKNVPTLRGNDFYKSISEKPHEVSFSAKQYDVSLPIDVSVRNEFITNHLAFINKLTDLKLVSKIESNIGVHLYYEQLFNGIVVYNGYLKVNLNKNGEQLSCFDHLYDTRNWQTISTSQNEKINVIVVENEKPFIATKQIIDGIEILMDANNAQLFSRDLKMRYMNDDTMVTAKVFRPDPLSTAKVLYGTNGTYKHFNDSDYALINDQRVSVTFPATLDVDTFRLQNKFCRIVDMQAPKYANGTPINTPSVSKNPDFTFTRGKNGFKDAMAMYHIYNYKSYLISLGFNNVVPWQLKVDPFGSSVDNSFFLPDVDTALYFGAGLVPDVPDAEDADVIVHEFTHAVRYSLNPAWPTGADRWAVEEGSCDVMAALYSHAYTDFNWRWLYNWDGHNEFWNGRDANTINASSGKMKKYTDAIGDRYYDSEIWSSCLLDIDEAIGRDAITTLLLTAMYSLAPNTSMPDAAKLIMQADSIVYQSYNTWKMGKFFNQRVLGSFSEGINDVTNNPSFKIMNTAGFFNGDAAAEILLSEHADVSIYDLSGKKKFEWLNVNGNIKIDPSLFEKGMYILRIKTETGLFSSKLLREN